MSFCRLTTLLVATLLIAYVSTAQTTQSITDKVDAILSREMKERRIPGAQVAVVQRGQVVLLRAYGIANLQDSVPVINRTVFAINSCTKAFTGVAIMQLVEAGKVDLSAPVSRYLDGLPEAWQPVTIRQLLTHVSGLPDILRKLLNPTTGALQGQDTEETVWAKVQTLPMEFPTGTQFSYNQTNYVLLGKIIDKLTGQSFALGFREKQFAVAGMPNTVFGDSRDVIPHMAQQYRYSNNIDGKTLPKPQISHFYYEFPASRRTASGLNSTAEDMAHWLVALQKNKLLHTKSALNTLWTAGTYNNGSPTQWALGWVTKPRPKHHAITATGGGRSAFFVYPDDELAVIVLTNLAGASPEDYIDELAGCFDPSIPAADPITALRMQLQQRGFENAIDVVNDEKKRNPAFHPSEDDLNDWAYRMMSRGLLTEAISIFKLNVSLYPNSWNVYDSYGEALLKNGQTAEAIAMYKKSVTLNPDNQGGKKVLERLVK